MANTRTEACRYPSRYGCSRWVTAIQYLAEVMCEKRARQERKTLPPEFWKDKHWKGVFLQQVAAASRLIKRLDPENTGTGASAISAFLRTETGKGCYSLMGAWIVPHIERCHRTVVMQKQKSQVIQPRPEAVQAKECLPVNPRPAFVPRPSLAARLRKLDE